MSKKNIIIALIAFIVGFGCTFYIIKSCSAKKDTIATTTTATNTTDPK